MKRCMVGLIALQLIVGCRAANVWEDGYASVDALGEAVVDALNRADADALRRLRVTQDEFVGWMWNEFPASRPPQNFPADFGWSNLNKNSAVGAERWVKAFGNGNWTYVEMRFKDPTKSYKGFKLLRGTTLVVRATDGTPRELNILGSVVQRGNRVKLLSYQED